MWFLRACVLGSRRDVCLAFLVSVLAAVPRRGKANATVVGGQTGAMGMAMLSQSVRSSAWISGCGPAPFLAAHTNMLLAGMRPKRNAQRWRQGSSEGSEGATVACAVASSDRVG